jgi:GTP-binding protein
MFLDEANVDVKGGDGGKGVVAFRREKFVPRGGPNGGHGGDGGNVVFVADGGLNTLHKFRFTKRYEGGRGGHGGGNDCHGRNGEVLRVTVPVGTIVREEGLVLADLVEDGQEVVVARGGRGGRGNAAFKSSTNQAPRVAELGEVGEEKRLRLELKLIADVGIVGLPNAGKSTLLSVISGARPKIADYPFTTLVPNLGVADVGFTQIVFADIPGLIEGASEGLGLGDRFLRHVERTRLLLHLVDASAESPLEDWATINAELAAFSPALAARPQVVTLTKQDLVEAREALADLREAFLAAGADDVLAISAVSHTGLQEMLEHVTRRLDELPVPEPAEEGLPVLRPVEADEDAYTVLPEEEGIWRVRGVRVERTAAMTDWENDYAIERFQRILEAMGVMSTLRDHELEEGDLVRVGEHELEWVL